MLFEFFIMINPKQSPLSQPVQPHPRLSVSQQMHEKFERRKLWRRGMALTYIAVLIIYLVWRFTILNPYSMGLSIAYYVAEMIGFLLGVKAIFNSWHYNHREPIPAPAGLNVDVFLPVYKEPLEIIRRTAIAAKNIRYPHRTVILDDGKRDELEQLAHELGIDYLRRPDHVNAKAGNLNYGLKHSSAEFVAVFDADHIALPHALDVMLGFFIRDIVAMVQTPQDYYNINAFQYVNSKSGALWHDQSVFYNIVQPCADKSNSAECVGTGVVYRRSSLNLIGGIPTTTVTEDTHTSLLLHQAGLETVYINEPVAYGLAAADLGEYYKTRHRWGFGNLQVLRQEKILTCKNLTLRQRIHYFFLSVIYLEGWQQLIIFLIPCFTLFFGLQSFTVTVFNTLIIMTFPFLSYALLQEIGCGFTRYWANEIFSMARWPVYIKASLGLFGGKMQFLSSLKSARGSISWKMMLPQILVMLISITAILVGMFHLSNTDFKPGPLMIYLGAIFSGSHVADLDMHTVVSQGYSIDLFILSSAWAFYTIARVMHFVKKSHAVAKQSHDYFRFEVPIPVRFDDGEEGCVVRISEEWVEIRHYGKAFQVGEAVDFIVYLPAGELKLKMRAEINGAHLQGSLIWDSTERRDALANSLYSVDWHREFMHRSAHFKTPSDLITSLFNLASGNNKSHTWQAVLIDRQYGIISYQKSKTSGSLIVFNPLEIGENYSGRRYDKRAATKLTIQVMGLEALHSLAETGLDGAKPRRYEVSLKNES